MTVSKGPLRRRVIQEDVHERLLEMLTSGDLAPGDRLAVEKLAEILGVSPTPVREALFTLQSTGLVVYLPQRGFRVAPPPTAAEFEELMDMRRLMEGEAARLAARRTDPRSADLLREIDTRHRELGVEASRAGASLETQHDYLSVGAHFHGTIFELSGNRYLRQLAESLNAQAARTRQSLLIGVHDGPAAAREHSEIVRAIIAGDESAAEAAARSHVDLVRRRAGDEALASAD